MVKCAIECQSRWRGGTRVFAAGICWYGKRITFERRSKHHFRTHSLLHHVSKQPSPTTWKLPTGAILWRLARSKATLGDLKSPKKSATEKFTPCLMYYTLIALATPWPLKSLRNLAFICLEALKGTFYWHHQLCLVSHVGTTRATVQALTSSALMLAAAI